MASRLTARIGQNFNGYASGNAFADFLLGDVYKFTQTAGKAKYTRGHQFAAFAQEDWHVTRKLNLGFRWPFFPYTDPNQGQLKGTLIPSNLSIPKSSTRPPYTAQKGSPLLTN